MASELQMTCSSVFLLKYFKNWRQKETRGVACQLLSKNHLSLEITENDLFKVFNRLEILCPQKHVSFSSLYKFTEMCTTGWEKNLST